MSIFSLQATSNTPKVSFNSKTGALEMTGRLLPESALHFFEPLIQWMERHVDTQPKKTELHLRLEYMSTTASKYLLDVFKQMNLLHASGTKTTIFWFCEIDDEDMLETGEDFKSLTDCPFVIKEEANLFG